jgi:hypothetical protein
MGDSSLPYKKDLRVETDEEEELDSLSLWIRIILCPVLYPVLFCYSLVAPDRSFLDEDEDDGSLASEDEEEDEERFEKNLTKGNRSRTSSLEKFEGKDKVSKGSRKRSGSLASMDDGELATTRLGAAISFVKSRIFGAQVAPKEEEKQVISHKNDKVVNPLYVDFALKVARTDSIEKITIPYVGAWVDGLFYSVQELHKDFGIEFPSELLQEFSRNDEETLLDLSTADGSTQIFQEKNNFMNKLELPLKILSRVIIS